jgi:hypothetical protein
MFAATRSQVRSAGEAPASGTRKRTAQALEFADGMHTGICYGCAIFDRRGNAAWSAGRPVSSCAIFANQALMMQIEAPRPLLLQSSCLPRAFPPLP